MPRTDPPVALPPIPAKRYFTIGEVSELTLVKPHVLRYWEQEFTQLKPLKRRGNRRYYQHHEVLLIRRIRELLYQYGFTISGARNHLDNDASSTASTRLQASEPTAFSSQSIPMESSTVSQENPRVLPFPNKGPSDRRLDLKLLRAELEDLHKLLTLP
ncbi:MAG: MerR family transcriptional regulator [Burkholderiaceae bacterium]|nr:MerR family transcriptional regulator [Burkholderiaceae bacterium]